MLRGATYPLASFWRKPKRPTFRLRRLYTYTSCVNTLITDENGDGETDGKVSRGNGEDGQYTEWRRCRHFLTYITYLSWQFHYDNHDDSYVVHDFVWTHSCLLQGCYGHAESRYLRQYITDVRCSRLCGCDEGFTNQTCEARLQSSNF